MGGQTFLEPISHFMRDRLFGQGVSRIEVIFTHPWTPPGPTMGLFAHLFKPP